MVTQTLVQTILQRPLRRYGYASAVTATTTTTADPTASRAAVELLYSTRDELPLQVCQHHGSSTSRLVAEPPPSPSAEVHPVLDTRPDSGTPDDPDDVFYTPAASPTVSSPKHSAPGTPSITPLNSAASSTASLLLPPDAPSSTTSLPDRLSSSVAPMIPIAPPPRRKPSPQQRLTYTDKDWAKDVRWLVAPQISGPSGKQHVKKALKCPSSTIGDFSSHSASSGSPNSTHSYRYPYGSVSPQYSLPRPASSKGHGHSKSKSVSSRNMVGMTVLLEVDEPLDESSASKSSPLPIRAVGPRRSRSFTYSSRSPERSSNSRVLHSPRTKPSKLTRQRSSSFPPLFPPPGTKRPSSPASRGHTRSNTGLDRAASTALCPMSTISLATSSTSKSPYTSAPSNALDALAAHVSDTPGALPSIGTRGFTSLVLPRAAPSTTLDASSNIKPSWKSRREGYRSSVTVSETLSISLGMGDGVDLTLAGLAQTTMASVEVVRGIAGGPGRGDRKATKGRASIFGVGWFGAKNQQDQGKSGRGKGNVTQEMESPLGFTAYRAPPVYVGGNEVLVQVWAVGLNGTDARLVGVLPPCRVGSKPSGVPYGTKGPKSKEKNKVRLPAVGSIPGRSFVGRVLEVGWEVCDEVVRRGDWVIGLMSVQKCGSLTEFIIVDRHRIHRVPHPRMLGKTVFAADDGDLGRGASFRPGSGLSLDQLALLPLSGLPAYRAVRTCLHITQVMGKVHRHDSVQTGLHPLIPPLGDGSSFSAEGHESIRPTCLVGESRPRALVLRGHDGSGALAVQMLIHDGWSVWAHVPVPFALPGPALEVSSELRDEEEEKELESRRTVLRRIEDRLRGWGVDEVLFLSVTSSHPSASFGESLPDLPPSGSSPSIHLPRSSSSSSQSTSPSPFSVSSRSSPLSSPYSHMHSASSSGGHPHAFSFLQPHTYTPLPLPPYDTEQGSVVALLDYLSRSRVRMDAILDTVGGRDVWEAGRTLLARPVRPKDGDSRRKDVEAQFTTLVGDAPDRVFASAGDNFKAGIRALRIGASKSVRHGAYTDETRFLSFEDGSNTRSASHPNLHLQEPLPRSTDEDENERNGVMPNMKFKPRTKTKPGLKTRATRKLRPRAVNYAWVSVVSDIDWEGNGVCETLGAVHGLAVEHGVRPAVGPVDFPPPSSSSSPSPGGQGSSGARDKGKRKAVSAGGENIEDEVRGRVVPFENTPDVFVPGGALEYGGTVVSRIAG